MWRVFRNDTGRCVMRGSHGQAIAFVGSDDDYYTIVKG